MHSYLRVRGINHTLLLITCTIQLHCTILFKDKIISISLHFLTIFDIHEMNFVKPSTVCCFIIMLYIKSKWKSGKT